MENVKLVQVDKYYQKGKKNEVHALQNVNAVFHTGEMVAIVDVSGSGKSTLLNLLSQMDSLTSGQIYYQDREISGMDAKQQAHFRNEVIGYIPQDIGLLANDTVLDNVEIPLLFNKKIKSHHMKQLVREALDRVGMADYIIRKVKTLSGGQKQRVAIARAIVNNPALILADEPTGALDTKTAAEIVEVFRSLVNDQTTVVIVTHDPRVAAQCDRVFEMADGVLTEKEKEAS